jgi:carboxylesterase type B
LISDVEYEVSGTLHLSSKSASLLLILPSNKSAIWKSGIENMKAEDIASIIDECCGKSSKLQELYHIYPDRPASCYYGALDLINDARFAFPAFDISEKWRKASPGNVHQCIVDEPNPWQASSRAHHAVDLIFLFGGIDLTFNPAAERAASKLRESWLTFVHGEDPWVSDVRYSFGPFGRCGEVGEAEYRTRRRVQCFEHLRSLGIEKCRQVSGRLAAGRVSLLN